MIEQETPAPAQKATEAKTKKAPGRSKPAPARAAAVEVADAKPATRKRAGTRRRTTGGEEPAAAARPASITAGERERMIAEAAYYRAEKRGFDGTQAVRDWLDAEAEVDALLMNNAPGD